jgi:PTH1 family peptidyl-tRNA hydrolase
MVLFSRRAAQSNAERNLGEGMPEVIKPLWVVLGLANPGSQYAGTRHNVGAEAVQEIADERDLSLKSEKGIAATVASYEDSQKKVVLARSNTYMNESGLAARDLKKRYRLYDLSHLIVLHDELDLEPGTVRIKLSGGTAGHNGLKSIQSCLGSADFTRVRIGIGKPSHNRSGANHVLGRPNSKEREILDVSLQVAASAVVWITEYGIESAMNKYNSRQM